MQNTSRRQFFHDAASAVSVAALAEQVIAQTASAAAHGLPTRILGRTGQRVPVLCLGGYHLRVVKDDSEAIRIMHAAIDEGLTFFDNAWEYHNGASEEIMGRALAMDGRRGKVFLMTKNCGRDYQGSMSNLEDSLRRLKTDRIDLWQFHEVIYDNDPDWIFEKGALKAAEEARRAGKIRYIGFTGHKDPRIHLKMLAKPFLWDTAQMPINVMDAHYRSFQKQVVPVCLRQNVAVLGMKSLCGGGTEARLTAGAKLAVGDCLRYALSQPVSTIVSGITSLEQLRQNVAVARGFQPMGAAERQAFEARVKDLAGDGRYELFKSMNVHDGPVHRRQHGFALA
ncbi:MAG: aldo/keto reductase [Bryobacterales bacterium]|nr:aldo/keto reductase [Bryobacterales bacterium]